MLYPSPVVVDADVLIRDVQYLVKTGRIPRRIRSASGSYSQFTGVGLFTTSQVFGETIRHLPDVAERTHTSEAEVRAAWNEHFVPKVRVVALDDKAIRDPRVAGVRALHPADAPTAALAALLAPAVLVTDNRKHFRPFGIPDVKSDAIAEDTVTLADFGVGVRGAMLLPTLAGAGLVEGTKKLTVTLGKDAVALVWLVATAGVGLFLTSGRGRAFLAQLSRAAREAGPPLNSAIEQVIAAERRVSAFAVKPLDEPDALGVVARRLAVGQAVMTTLEVAQELQTHGFGLERAGNRCTRTRAWLINQCCFQEQSRGRWTLGYHAAELPREP